MSALTIGFAAAASAVGLVYAAIVRPRIRRWGATDAEIAKALPGDELPSPTGYRPVSTRAIIIDAPPDDVWPWLVQMGSGRACPVESRRKMASSWKSYIRVSSTLKVSMRLLRD
jgi:hypothetical protein